MEHNSCLCTKALYIFTALFIAICVPTKLVSCANQGHILPRICTNVGTFRVTFGGSFEACIDECQRRQRCEVVMYKHGINECSLKDFINITGLKEGVPVCLFANVNEWKRNGQGTCEKNSCGLTETCVTSSTDKNRFQCIKTECHRPQAIDYTKLISNKFGIGDKCIYKCDPVFIGDGDPFITCRNDGTWTPASFKCVQTGRKPASDLGIADIISVEGEEWLPGTRINFACRPGYQGLGTNTSSVLNSKGMWNPKHVHCCNENITESIWWNTCIATFNASFARSVQDINTAMNEYCKNKGGNVRFVEPRIAEHVFRNEGYQWIINRKKSSFHKSLKTCLTSNKAYDLLNDFSKYSYNELLDKVADRGLQGHWTCNTVKWWALNEPNGGDAEGCVVYRNGTFGMFDVACSTIVFEERPDPGFVCATVIPEIREGYDSP